MQSNAEYCCRLKLRNIYRFRLTMKDKSLNQEDSVFHTYVYSYDNNPKVYLLIIPN